MKKSLIIERKKLAANFRQAVLLSETSEARLISYIRAYADKVRQELPEGFRATDVVLGSEMPYCVKFFLWRYDVCLRGEVHIIGRNYDTFNITYQASLSKMANFEVTEIKARLSNDPEEALVLLVETLRGLSEHIDAVTKSLQT